MGKAMPAALPGPPRPDGGTSNAAIVTGQLSRLLPIVPSNDNITLPRSMGPPASPVLCLENHSETQERCIYLSLLSGCFGLDALELGFTSITAALPPKLPLIYASAVAAEGKTRTQGHMTGLTSVGCVTHARRKERRRRVPTDIVSSGAASVVADFLGDPSNEGDARRRRRGATCTATTVHSRQSRRHDVGDR
ncbi:predicted protein [Postia placenta Mad-698-R]|uniref:Uncharacterized protein n=1 Tax=Postia placenta MAD-698-R-SB12 TaxID=670580 RepID=A0A1X6NAP0_9APHY|nr:hypothetical protein POSPLADRAFT_1044959 [Postia placenta MAD-698-R-SB12]EED78948.1 predicted protein [Postia placenta Mad-698-R]OSX65634.1 hypothetical protein POSPLADRAFT_1044959 [Postia placenta MAD-698-R-SB12]